MKRSPRQSVCQNPDCARAQTGEYGPPATFQQAPGRHRPRLYCNDKCSVWTNRHFLRVRGAPGRQAAESNMDASGSSILVPKSTRFIIPASSIADGETFSYRAAVRAVEWIAGQAGVAKGSPIRTALLQGMEVPAAGAVVSLEPGPVIGVTGDSGGRSAEYGSSGDDEVGHSPIDTYEDRTAPEMLDLTAMVMTLPEELRAAISAHYPPSTRLCARVWRLDPAIGNALMARFHPQEHEAAARVAVRKETYRGWEKWRLEVRRSPERNRRFAMRSKRTPIVICHRAAPIECLE